MQGARAEENAVSKASEDSKRDKFQSLVIGKVYEKIAQMLPTEGRDYSVSFSFDYTGNTPSMSISFKPYTAIGKIWCNYCSRELNDTRR